MDLSLVNENTKYSTEMSTDITGNVDDKLSIVNSLNNEIVTKKSNLSNAAKENYENQPNLENGFIEIVGESNLGMAGRDMVSSLDNNNDIGLKNNIEFDTEKTINDDLDLLQITNTPNIQSLPLNLKNSTEIESISSSLTGNVKRHSEENILKNNDYEDNSIEIESSVKNEISRRNSLPETYLVKSFRNDTIPLNGDVLDTYSISELTTDFSTSDLAKLNLNKSNRNKHIDKKNISDVVKNVHGIFSFVGGSLKNAYRPMEKNLSGMVLATQRNLAMAKHDYLRDRTKTVENKNNLPLSNPEKEDGLFKKCDNFPIVEKNIADLAEDSVISQCIDEIKLVDNIELALQPPAIMLDKTSMSKESLMNENSTVVHSEQYILNTANVIPENTINENHLEIIIENENLEISKSNIPNQTESIEYLKGEKIELETKIMQMNAELNVLKVALVDKDTIKRNLESKINLFMKQLETIKAERDATVVRYAVSERNALEAIKAKEIALASEQNSKREVSMITQRLRTANADRTRASGALDMKCHELSLSQKEVSKLKDELQSAEVKLKWAQSKLVSEMDGHKESSALVEKLTMQLKQLGGEACPMPIPQPVEIDSQLREKDAMIILEKHEREKFETRSKQLQSEVDQIKTALNIAHKEIKELRAQVESGTAESAALRRTCSELRDQGAKDCERLAAAQARAARCDTLATHLQQEQDRSAKLAQELEAMRILREEALAEGELRMRREAELLRQAERLTAAGVKLQATCSEAEAKALALTVDNVALKEAAVRAAAESAEARAELANEREGRADDARALASRAAQHARGEREALSALEAAKGELRVLSTKHASALKELKRELLQAKRKCERFEAEGKLSMVSDKLSSEKTGSTSSLSSYDGFNHQSEVLNSIDNHSIGQTPDNQQLVERIVNLQRAAARRSEKLEFMEEHNRQLTQELQRKTRLLRSLLMATPSGGLASAASDAVKAEIGRHGGVMASVYGSQVVDETMTLELSLEINAKLQSLLEDTLLSNITLKENMDTLGDEISRLKESRKSGRSHK